MDKEQNHIKDLSNYIFATYNVRYNILTHELELNGNPITDLDKNSIYIDCKEKFKRVIKVDVLSRLSTLLGGIISEVLVITSSSNLSV